jgi:Vacuolar protein sorting 55
MQTSPAQYVHHRLNMQGCILYDNWWPMLTAFLYVLVPMPYMFFGAGSGDSLYSNDMEIGCAAAAPGFSTQRLSAPVRCTVMRPGT